MANSAGGGATPILAFLVGGLIVAVAVLGLFVFDGHWGNAPNIPTHLTMNVTPAPRSH